MTDSQRLLLLGTDRSQPPRPGTSWFVALSIGRPCLLAPFWLALAQLLGPNRLAHWSFGRPWLRILSGPSPILIQAFFFVCTVFGSRGSPKA